MDESQVRELEEHPPPFAPADAAGLFLRGLAMGAADIVPGVSGGTIAFITGIYERFIVALKSISVRFLLDLARGRAKQAVRSLLSIHWALLAPLGLGIVLAIIGMSKLIPDLMEDHPGPTYAFFFGLILASAWMPFARMKKRTSGDFVIAIVFAVSAFLFVGLTPDGLSLRSVEESAAGKTVFYPAKIREPGDVRTIRDAGLSATPEDQRAGVHFVLFDEKGLVTTDHESLFDSVDVLRTESEVEAFLATASDLVVLEESRAGYLWILACGMIAISAMILPGLSGSFLLLFLGQYHAVLSAIHGSIDGALSLLGRERGALAELVDRLWWDDMLFLGVFIVGVLCGVAIFSRVVTWLFEHKHDLTMAALTGLMIGALRQPGRESLDALEVQSMGESQPRLVFFVVGAAVVGALLVAALSFVESRLRRSRTSRASMS